MWRSYLRVVKEEEGVQALMWRSYLRVSYHPLLPWLLIITLTHRLPNLSSITFPPIFLLPHAPYQSILQSSCTRVLLVPSSERTELWESRPPEPSFVSRHLLGCVRAIRFLGSVSTTARRLHLHRNGFISFRVSSSNRPSTSRWMFEGRHCVHLPATTVVHDFEQLTMSGFRATGALSMGPSVWYIFILKLVKFNLFSTMISMMFINIFAANPSSSKITHEHIFIITNLLIFFSINFNMKLPKFRTFVHIWQPWV